MIADVKIHASLRRGITYLKGSYFTPPMKVSDVTEDKTAPELHLMLVSSSPGILDDDQYDLNVKVDEKCSVCLCTQSYQRLFMMRHGARQVMDVHLDNDSSFTYIPHPTVPHENSIFSSYNRIFLSEGCRLIWGEVITCGRNLGTEVFKFSKLQSVTEIFRNSRLILKENLRMYPKVENLNAIGRMEGFTHQATLIYLEEQPSYQELKEAIHAQLAMQAGLIYGITAAPGSGLIVRILGQGSEQLFSCLKEVGEYIRRYGDAHQMN